MNEVIEKLYSQGHIEFITEHQTKFYIKYSEMIVKLYNKRM